MVGTDRNKDSLFTESFRKDWDKYATKYNALSNKLRKAHINPMLLSEVEDLRVEIEMKYGNRENEYPVLVRSDVNVKA